MKRVIDLKHHADVIGENVEIVKTGNGIPIPKEEPMALFRGRDRLAVSLLIYYKDLCRMDGCNDFQLGQMDELIDRFKAFRRDHPEAMKQPGVTRGA